MIYPGFLFSPSLVTWNPSDIGAGLSLSNKNLTVSSLSGLGTMVRATQYKSSLKRYFEITINNVSESCYGIAQSNANLSQYVGDSIESWGWFSSGNELFHNGNQIANPSTYTTGDILMFGVDMMNGYFYFGKNGTWDGGQNPSLGSGGYSIISGAWTPGGTPYSTGAEGTANFGSSPFAYTPPSGFIPWDA